MLQNRKTAGKRPFFNYYTQVSKKTPGKRPGGASETASLKNSKKAAELGKKAGGGGHRQALAAPARYTVRGFRPDLCKDNPENRDFFHLHAQIRNQARIFGPKHPLNGHRDHLAQQLGELRAALRRERRGDVGELPSEVLDDGLLGRHCGV